MAQVGPMIATVAVSDWICGLKNPLGLIDTEATREAFRAAVRRRVDRSLPGCRVVFVDHATNASVHEVVVTVDLEGVPEPYGQLTAWEVVRGAVWDILKADGFAVRVPPSRPVAGPAKRPDRLRGWQIVEFPDGTTTMQEVDEEYWNSGEVTSWSG